MLFTKSSTAMLSLFTLLVAASPAPEPLSPRALCNGTITLDETVQFYVIQPADGLQSIADKFKRGICDIAKANSIADINSIQAGANLTIPAQVCIPDTTSCIRPEVTATSILGGPGSYVVVSGDTLTTIAVNYQITLQSLIAANPQITNPDFIVVQQIINVPVLPGSVCGIRPYVLKAGDKKLDELAATIGSTVGQLLTLNPGIDATKLQAGQNITLAFDCRGP